MIKQTKVSGLPIIIVWIVFYAVMKLGKSFLEANGFDWKFLFFANLFLLLISLAGFMFQQKGLQSPNPNAFVRSVYASMMLKMFLTMIAVFIYAFLFKSKINKPGLFTAMGMYIVYTVVEVTTLMKALKNKKNA